MRYYGDGSSPRARGTLRRHGQLGASGRFIPACAGNAASCRTSSAGRPVHPRVRGERPVNVNTAVNGGGSSPRARGTRWGRFFPLSLMRFIPACAGNATWRLSATPCRTVHPRVRGERRYRPARGLDTIGSSPRARGTQTRLDFLASIMRFIPACAGNAFVNNRSYESVAVHPRVRGERS